MQLPEERINNQILGVKVLTQFNFIFKYQLIHIIPKDQNLQWLYERWIPFCLEICLELIIPKEKSEHIFTAYIDAFVVFIW